MRIGWLLVLLLCACVALPAGAALTINEIDSNQTGLDQAEFVELYDGGVGETSLDGLVLVFFNGESDSAYFVQSLAGQSTDAEGYFVAGSAGVSPRPDLVIPDNTLQNGADAVAVFDASLVDFEVNPTGPVTTAGLVAAAVYGNGQEEDAGLLVLLEFGQPQVDEQQDSSGDVVSLQRCPSDYPGARETAGFVVGLPTPGAANRCPQEPARVVINEVDANQADLDTEEFVELYDGGVGRTSLDGLVLVFFNGAVETSYLSVDLDGLSTDAEGYFLLGSAATAPNLILADGAIQNGPDAVALYAGGAEDFPAGTPVQLEGLRDAVVYTSGTAQPTGLLALVSGAESILEEGAGGSADTLSLQRCPNGEGLPLSLAPFAAAVPTPRERNTCALDLPVADFSVAPLQAFAGEPVSFTNTSQGNIDSWTWTFEGGSPAGATGETPEDVLFAEPGSKVVTLLVSGPGGDDIQTRSFEVLDPLPAVAGVSVSNANPEPCDSVLLAALNPTGQAPLDFAWSIADGGGAEILSGTGTSIVWDVDALAAPENYTATLTVSNGLGEVSVQSAPIAVASNRPVVELSTQTPALTNLAQAEIEIVVDSGSAMAGLGGEDLLLSNATLAAFEGADNLYSAVVNFLGDGAASVQVRDGAGSIRCGVPSLASNVLTFTYDATAPVAELGSAAPPVFTDAGIFVDVLFSESVTGLEESDFVVSNGTIGNLEGAGDGYVVTVLAGSPGEVTVSLKAGAVIDAAQNENEAPGPLIRSYLSKEALFTHSADADKNGVISLTELLRVVQLYNAGELHCDNGTEDGYAPGAGGRECAPHRSDYVAQDWAISLSELLRAVQLYAAGAYYACDGPGAEDGYCLGAI